MIAVSMFSMLLALAGVLSAVQILYVNGATGLDNVDCGTAGHPCKTINYAVGRAFPDAIIDIASGTYNQNVVINRKNLTLRGKGTTGATATIINGGNLGPAVNVSGPARVDLYSMAIKNGNPGLNANYAFIYFDSCLLTNNNRGVNIAYNSYLRFKNSQANSNVGDGLMLFGNSSASLESSKFLQNSGSGVGASLNASVNAISSTFANNQNAGIIIGNGCAGNITACTVSGNKNNGLHIPAKSSFRLGGGNIITANVNAGIQFGQGSEVTIQKAGNTLPDEIYLNTGRGIIVGDQAHLFFFDGKVHNNTSDGISLGGNAMAHFGAAAYITGNKGWGINCMDSLSNASRYVNDPGFGAANVSGNTLGQIKCLKHF